MNSEETPPGVDLTEAHWEWPDAFKTAVTERLLAASWRRYPARDQPEIIGPIAGFLGVDPGQVLVTRGVSEGIRLAFQLVTEDGAALRLPKPGFFGFREAAEALGLPSTGYPAADVFTDRTTRLAAAAEPAVSLVVCTPNNPTGHAISGPDLIEMCDHATAPVLVDLTYDLLAPDPVHPHLGALAARGAIAFISLSKVFALAGVRLGVVVADRPTIARLRAKQARFTYDYFQLAVLETVFTGTWLTEFDRRCAQTKELRATARWLLGMLVPERTILPVTASFLTIDYRDDISGELVDRLISKTAAKDFPLLFLLRITVNRHTLAGLAELTEVRSGPVEYVRLSRGHTSAGHDESTASPRLPATQ